MLKFTQAGSVQKLSGTRYWRVVTPFFWWIDYDKQDERIEVPENFITDFGSVPRLLWFIINPTEWNAFIIHDHCYAIRYKSRGFSDKILYDALRVEGCGIIQAFLIYTGVRIGGWYAWSSNPKNTGSNSTK